MEYKYFIISDIHSFLKEAKRALHKAGFRINAKNHILIILGDIFDRGPDALGVYKFIKSIPKERRILIRGNHEQLYFDLLKKDFPEGNDWSNHTVDTFCAIAGKSMRLLDEDFYDYDYDQYFKNSRTAWKHIKEIVREHEITKWLQSDEWVNYYELDKYIFVHSFIPKVLKKEYENEVVGHYRDTGKKAYAKDFPYLVKDISWFEFRPDWRDATDDEWKDAAWGNPWLQYMNRLFDAEIKNGKTLVCGHWHTSDFYYHLDFNKKYYDKCAPIYYSENLIGIDGGVKIDYLSGNYIHPQNVLVISSSDFNTCFDQNKNKLSK